MRITAHLVAACLSLLALPAHALQIVSLSPQGEVAQIRQVVAKFDVAAVNFGDPKAPAPLAVSCTDAQASKGNGRWISDKEWAFEFENDLPPGVSCTVALVSGFKSPGSTSSPGISGSSSYKFNSGGPFVRNVLPGSYQRIDEEQFFVLRLNGPATLASVQANTWCAIDGLGERVPVKLIEGSERAELLKANGYTKAAEKEPLAYVTLRCNRRFTPDGRVQLVFGKGVATPSGVANSVEKRFAWQVREPFAANFSCERENAQSACLPIRPMSLSFNAPVPRKLAEGIRLKSAKDTIKPTLEGDDKDKDSVVNGISFPGPFAEQTPFTLELPSDFKDSAGRTLRNADNFPLKVSTAGQPPLAKFAAAPFGIVERLAEPDGAALMPVTLRNVEAALKTQSLTPGKVSELQPKTDAEIIAWFSKITRYHESSVDRKQAAKDSKLPIPKVLEKNDTSVQSRMVSLLGGQPGVKTLDLPKPSNQDPRPFEVVGIPLQPGFHVLEIASQKLGGALLDERYGDSRTMYVRSSALVTNLAVHFKLGRENAAAWVTTLAKGQVVPGATVQVSDCTGKMLATATTNAQGVADIKGLSPAAPNCNGRNRSTENDEMDGDYGGSYFVSARATVSNVADLAFTWSNWHKGIEPWRFNVPTSREPQPDVRAHTIFDRTLLRAGETVSMKHLIRSETSKGFGVPDYQNKTATLEITHVGSGQQFSQVVTWRKTGTGGLSAANEFAIPPAAKLGMYEVKLGGIDTGSFRVEEFRLPVLEGRVGPSDKAPLVNAKQVPTDVQITYVQGGGAANLPVRVSALVRGKYLSYPDYEEFSFQPPRGKQAGNTEGEEEATASQDNKLIADKLPITLDKTGAGKLTIDKVPTARQPKELLMEATYSDPNGEVQTIRSVSTLWPAAVVAGIKTEGWVSSAQKIRFQALALDLTGKPAINIALQVNAIARITTTSRKRMVGGFYSYDNKVEIKDLGKVCDGKSDARGLLLCETRLSEAGEVELTVTAKDPAGNSIQAASSVWVTKQGELWFGGENHDRMDVLPEKKSYQPGDMAKFQVRMPFRFATALVAVEREGIIETQVVQLNGQDPTINLKVQDGWGPNVYVSVLALRGRLREVPWYSLFTWGYKAPREWWTAFWYEGREYTAPTALVDLSKPAFRLGLAEIRVGTKAHQLDVSVKADKESYPVRGSATVTITAKLPNGQPAAGAEVALAAVDQALLELAPNNSWDLLGAMLQRRSWGVETSTAQMEIIGRRHYGRKAVSAGGGGGRSGTRELLETLLLWKHSIVLDAKGQAVVTVPLNDALTSFKVVAVADAATGLFGTGQTTIRSTQDLQIISGLPPLVREDDQFRAQLTLRNTTKAAMKVEVTPRATMLELKPQVVDIPAGEAREVAWEVTAPPQLAQTRAQAILWEIEAKDTISGARDALKARQRLIEAVPLTVQQATLVQVDGAFSIDVNPPADALPGRGGLKLSLQPKLAEGMPGVRDYFARYPFICLEQKTSKAVGLRDGKLWQTVAAQIPTYLDADGLASYFPPRAEDGNRGSDTLTAYVLAATHEAASIDPAFALPDAIRAPMERGLISFIEGKISREFWSPQKDLDVRKLGALEALSRYGAAKGRMTGNITIAPNQWPTHAVIDWLNILKRVADVPERDKRMAEANQVLRARLSFQGTKAIFSTEKDDYWWWLMVNGDANTAKLILAVLDDPAWKDDMPRLANGFIGRQQRGAWHTTTANLWGGLALEKFSAKFEAEPVAGFTTASMGKGSGGVDWAKVERVKTTDPLGAPHQTTFFGAPASPGNLRNNSMFLLWTKDAAKDTLKVAHQGTGKPWLTLQSIAAIALKEPFAAGYQIKKTITPVEQAVPGKYTRGDVLRITLEVNGSADMTWVAITDPIPGGSTILGSGLGRDSQIATQGEKRSGAGWPAFEERSFESFRSYYEYLPKGVVKMEYTVRLNNVGEFALPPSRVEAMYAPEMFGEWPNARVRVEAGK